MLWATPKYRSTLDAEYRAFSSFIAAGFCLDHVHAYPVSALDRRAVRSAAFSEWRWVRTNDEQWYRLTRFFEKLFIINFGAGVATGITMEMAFGILYGPFSQAAGPFLGQILGYETITAFMYEAGFVGLMVFGWGKIGRKMHLFATANVAVASSLSAMWILVANSWMQTPTGVVLKNGYFQVVNWGAAIFNPDVIFGFPHMEVATIELALCFVAAVSAWQILKDTQRADVSARAEIFRSGADRHCAAPDLSRGWSGANRGGRPAVGAGGAGRPLPHISIRTARSIPRGTSWPGRTPRMTARPGPSPFLTC